ncbi:DUF1501 domain-containing protein [Aureispira anguillae]|uniref:DUF1501 domain-containing protein n=1 Tax=Aureispira anguillae TaxID=2864201 RepID=A0A915YBB5_9BACT|nr:DUF1501 domain-containing protein [Aureispira anguillae]BDS09935.1 DUF1501 domain-containing protein [Aureispira anguillae]
MKNISRRQFIQRSSLATAGTMTLPLFLRAFERPNLFNNNPKKLVVVQFSGGNDGLNAIVPYSNDIYYKNRPTIAVKASKVLKATDELGFNPKLKVLQSLYDSGDVCIINNIGYPNPDRSHFRSMDIWHTASDSNEFLSTGWLGRYLDSNCADCSNPHHAIEIDDTLSLALKGEGMSGFAMKNPNQLRNTTHSKIVQAVAQHHHDHDHEENVAYLYKTLTNTVASADYIYEKSKVYRSTGTYPKGKLGKELKQIAELIISESDTQIYYVTIGGFDTHNNQVNQQERLLGSYSEAMTAFVKDLKKNNKWEDTLVMTFSEFGRRVAENGSRGTDHGKGNNLYLMGGKLKKQGFYNQGPDLSRLDRGDVQFSVDFRRVYATILKDWLKTNDQAILKQQFQSLGIV